MNGEGNKSCLSTSPFASAALLALPISFKGISSQACPRDQGLVCVVAPTSNPRKLLSHPLSVL